jgi:hypothetical protein
MLDFNSKSATSIVQSTSYASGQPVSREDVSQRIFLGIQRSYRNITAWRVLPRKQLVAIATP